jgi:hypothetical protein
MPLVQSTLSNALLQIFTQAPLPADTTAAGQAWANAYHSYASAATAGPTTPLPPALLAAKTTLATNIKSAFDAARAAGLAGLAVVVAQLDAAFVQFWLTPPVAFAGPGFTGVVTVAPPGVLSGTLTTAFAPSSTAAPAATAIASALDLWTKTVIVTNQPTAPGPPVPTPLS